MAKSRKTAVQAASMDVFRQIVLGRDTSGGILSNDEIRRRNLEEYQRDCEAEKKANSDAAALAERTAKETELGITDAMKSIRAADARESERVTRVWNRDFATLAAHVEDKGVYAIDCFHQMTITDGPCERPPEDVDDAAAAFFAILEDEGVVLTEDQKRRILLYVGLNGIGLAERGIFIDPMATNTWRGALARLQEMGAVKPVRKSAPQSEKLEITDSSSREHDGKVAYKELEKTAFSLFDEWLSSLSTNFAFVPSKDQLDAAVKLLENRGLPLYDRASFDKVRVALCVKKIWPMQCLTTDEYIANVLMERYNLNDPRQKQAFKEECNRVRYQSGS
jgi:hypothetical protein